MENLISIDNFRNQNGDLALLNLFSQNPLSFISKLNTQNVSFPSFYCTLPVLSKHFHALNHRYQFAINICNNLDYPNFDELVSSKNPDIHSHLSWIFYSGFLHKSSDKNYHQVIDFCVSSLLSDFDDFKILPDVCRLIFTRNQYDDYIHDLVWSYFRAKDKISIKYLSFYLNSKNEKDQTLALSFFENFCDETLPSNPKQWFSWISENIPYMYYTEECYQFSSKPCSYRVDFQAKLLGKHSNTNDFFVFSDEEVESLQKIRSLDTKKFIFMSNHANSLRKNNKNNWERLSPSQKVDFVSKSLGGGFFA